MQFRALFFETRREGLGGGKTFIERGEFGAGRSELVLLGLDRPAKLRHLFHQARALGFYVIAAGSRRGMLILRTLGTLFRVFGIFPEAQEIVLADGQLEAEPSEFALHVLVAVSSGEYATFGIALLRRDLFQRLLRLAELRVHLCQSGLRLAHLPFKLRDFSVQSTQLALHPERTRFIRASTGDHAALVAGAVRRDEGELGIVARERLGGRCTVR